MKKFDKKMRTIGVQRLSLKMVGRFLTLRFLLVFFIVLILGMSGLLTYLIFSVLNRFSNYDIFGNRAMFSVVITLGASLLLATVMAFFLSFWLLRPMDALIEATREVIDGNFEVRISTKGCYSEVKTLVLSFNDMISELSSIEILRKNFINNFSHEFKTPIISIKGFAEQLMREDLSPEERREYQSYIVSESEKLAKLSTNILLLSKLESQEIVGEKSRYFLDEQIRNCLLTMQMEWEEKKIEPVLRMEPVLFYGNREMVALLWNNLISNAIKFNREGGSLTISCFREGDTVKVSISDEGRGMDEQMVDRIFDKLYQADGTKILEGNGLGLPIAKRIVELCGGRIEVCSSDLGTTFSVMFPFRK